MCERTSNLNAEHPSFERRRAGFSLVEMIVVAALLSVLTAILLPSLSKVGRAGDTALSLAALRQLHIGLTSYVFDHEAALPFFWTPGQPDDPPMLLGADMSLDPNYAFFRQQSVFWASLARPYLDGVPTVSGAACFAAWGESMGLPPEQDDDIVSCRFWLTHTAFAAPDYWLGEMPPDDLSLLRGTRLTQIRQPARKGLILDTAGGVLDSRYPTQKTNKVHLCMGDGSARTEEGFPAPSSVPRPYGAINYWPTMCTEGGLAGVDY